ncbi:MAG: autotransporter-associated N-terminal domain-containing protein, partial [Fusobacterium periodonticum]|nr:autotransporter-associated N-terminal domain-containing protein [Fusobacterium periodonticum]
MANYLPTVEKNLRSAARRYENVKYSLGLAILFLMKGTSAFSDDNKIQEAERKKDVLTNDQTKKSVVKETKAVTQANKKLKASWATMQFGANDMYSNFFVTPKTKVDKASIVKSENTILLASADNTSSLPTFSKISSDIEETYAPTTEEINTSKGNLRNSIGNLQEKINNARTENAKEVQGLKLELVQLMEQGNQLVKSPWSSWQFGANYFYEDWGGAYKGRGDKAKEKLELTKKTDPLERFKASSQMSSTYGTTSLDLVYE